MHAFKTGRLPLLVLLPRPRRSRLPRVSNRGRSSGPAGLFAAPSLVRGKAKGCGGPARSQLLPPTTFGVPFRPAAGASPICRQYK